MRFCVSNTHYCFSSQSDVVQQLEATFPSDAESSKSRWIWAGVSRVPAGAILTVHLCRSQGHSQSRCHLALTVNVTVKASSLLVKTTGGRKPKPYFKISSGLVLLEGEVSKVLKLLFCERNHEENEKTSHTLREKYLQKYVFQNKLITVFQNKQLLKRTLKIQQ